jgi:hypothetical protein
VARLVLDGVLEVATRHGYIGGPQALDLCLPDDPAEPEGFLELLSRRAVEYGARVAVDGVEALTARLYSYHRCPRTRTWAATYPDSTSVVALTATDQAVEWNGPARSASGGWLIWRRRGGHGLLTRDDVPYKLYVSPAMPEIPGVLGRLLGALAPTSAGQVKVAAGLGLLRPDKIVVYARDAYELAEAAWALAQVFGGVTAHGVPFTAGLAGDGLLSWAGDPSPEQAPIGDQPESWRSMICRCLAEYLCAARAAGLTDAQASRYALVRLSLDDVVLPQFVPGHLAAPPLLPPARAAS